MRLKKVIHQRLNTTLLSVKLLEKNPKQTNSNSFVVIIQQKLYLLNLFWCSSISETEQILVDNMIVIYAVYR